MISEKGAGKDGKGTGRGLLSGIVPTLWWRERGKL
jgi:hypothetical protein